eukprot:365600-Chlamydomonas_euryale.AAC.3
MDVSFRTESNSVTESGPTRCACGVVRYKTEGIKQGAVCSVSFRNGQGSKQPMTLKRGFSPLLRDGCGWPRQKYAEWMRCVHLWTIFRPHMEICTLQKAMWAGKISNTLQPVVWLHGCDWALHATHQCSNDQHLQWRRL